MKHAELKKLVALGEDSRRQFKADITNADSLAAELVAFSNSNGGVLFIGVADDGSIPGLASHDVRRINQLISNAATHNMRSPISPVTENIPIAGGRIVIAVTIPEGLDKPYFDRQGVIWIKSGSDRRRIQSKEELRRLFQMTEQFHADELPTKAGIEALDKLRFRDYLKAAYKQDYPDDPAELLKLLQNLNLATETGVLSLAGLLLFAEQPERFKPQFIFKAIRFPGNTIHASEFLDSEDFAGPIPKIFDGALAFVLRNLHKIQAGQGVNALGVPEIPSVVFEELLVNALVHRDYLVSAPIRMFIFDDRIEIISPGHLPNSLTVDKIKAGISNIRNPILVSHVSKGLLPYRGFASGIPRVLKEWPQMEFKDDREGCLFTAIVHRQSATQSATQLPTQSSDAAQVTAQLELRLESWLREQKKLQERASTGQVTSQVSAQVTAQVTAQVSAQVIMFCRTPRSAKEIMNEIGLKHWKTFQRNYLNVLLAIGFLERTIPDKPQSRLQKYRLTEAGRVLLRGPAEGENK